MSVEIRKANIDDADFLAWVMLIAGRSHLERGIWDAVTDYNEAESLRFLRTAAITGTPHTLHYSNFIVAEADGRQGAALCGFDPEISGENSLMANLGAIVKNLGWSDEYFQMAMQRIAPHLICHFGEQPGVWVIECVAARPEFRRRGLVNSLLDRVLDAGRERGFHRAQIGVLIGNNPAIQAYKKAGFAITQELTDPVFEAAVGEPGSYLMTREM